MEGKILYHDSPGKENTDDTLKIVRNRTEELNIKQIVVATNHGSTALRAHEILKGLSVEIIAVSICAALEEEGWAMSSKERSSLEDKGIRVLTSLHALGDDVSECFSAEAPNRIVRETLYRFCQGMKVTVEIAIMAADAGLLDMSSEIISVAGTGEGADTAIVLKPAYAHKFNELEIREILAKPRQV